MRQTTIRTCYESFGRLEFEMLADFSVCELQLGA